MEDSGVLALDKHMEGFYWYYRRGAWTYWLIEVEDDSYMISTCHFLKEGYFFRR